MKQNALQSVCRLAVGVFVAAAIAHTWLVMGLVVPVTVAGSSMATTLQGPRRMFRCDATQTETELEALSRSVHRGTPES